MCEGYHAAGDDGCSYVDAGLDEYLCEYVDDTMDPVVRAAFEEYLRGQPALIEHVERLRYTRTLLCHYGCRRRAPKGLQARLRQRLSREMLHAQRPLFAPAVTRLGTMAAFTSAMVIMLVAGLTLGEALLVDEPPAPHRISLSQPAALHPSFNAQSFAFPTLQPRFSAFAHTPALLRSAPLAPVDTNATVLAVDLHGIGGTP